MKIFRLVAFLVALSPLAAHAQFSGSDMINITSTGGGGGSISLTTSGTSGASTLTGSVLNIPIYSNGSSLGVAASTTSTTEYPLFYTTTTGGTSTVFIDNTSPLSYVPSTGTLSLDALSASGNVSLSGTTTISGALNVAAPCVGCNGAAVVYPETYGAKGNAGWWFDGAVSPSNVATAQSLSLTATNLSSPTVTTNVANDVAVTVFMTNAAWTTTPTGGTVRENGAYASNTYGVFALDNTITTAGATSAVTGITSASAYSGIATMALQPTTTTISFIAGSLAQQTTGYSTTINKPTGTTTGDYLVACINYYDGVSSAVVPIASYPPSPSWMTILDGNLNQSGSIGQDFNCYGKVATSSEPSTYTFNQWQTSNTGSSAVMMDYRNVAGIDGQTLVLTSSSAAFSASTSGDPICVGGVQTGQGQRCGTIASYNSASSVNLSFPLAQTLTGLTFSYGNDDTSAWTTMLTSAPCTTTGCQIKATKKYAITGPLSITATSRASIYGAGPDLPNDAYGVSVGHFANNIQGSAIIAETQSLTSPILSITGPSGFQVDGSIPTLQDIAIYGGAGLGRDGAGNNCLSILNWQGFTLNNLVVYNCVNNNIYEDGFGGSDSGVVNISARAVNAGYAGQNNLLIGGGNTHYIQNVGCEDTCIFQAAGEANVHLAGTTTLFIDQVYLADSIIQWGEAYGPGFSQDTEVQIDANSVSGGTNFINNYVECDSTLGSRCTSSLGPVTTSLIYVNLLNNNYWENPTTFTYPTYRASGGTALPTCSAGAFGPSYKQYTAIVTDATSCINGQTYTSGGSHACNVICNGTNWIESSDNGYQAGDTISANSLSFTATTATAPANGIYQNVANNLLFTTSGSTALTLSTTGNGTFKGTVTDGTAQLIDTCNGGLAQSAGVCSLATSGTSNVPFKGSAGTPTCGTGCSSITSGSTDQRGSMVSSSSVSSVTLNFSTTLGYTPFCTISDSNTSAVADISSITTSALTVSLASALSAVTIYWNCVQ